MFETTYESFGNRLCDSIAKLRETNHFTDIKLRVEGEELKAHKMVLSACSPFFRAMFNDAFIESRKDVVELQHETNFAVMSAIVDYMYSGKLTIAIDELPLLLMNFDYFQMEHDKRVCEQALLTGLSKENCINSFALSEKVSLENLRENSMKIIYKYFPEICTSQDIQRLNQNQFEAILKETEDAWPDATYKAIMPWVRYDRTDRTTHTQHLLSRYVDIERLTEELTEFKLPAYIVKNSYIKDEPGHSQWLIDALIGDMNNLSLYIIDVSPSTYKFRTQSRKLIPLEKPPRVFSYGAAKSKSIIYAFGSRCYGSRETDSCAKYEIEAKIWRGFSCDLARINCGVCATDAKIYLIGGCNDGLLKLPFCSYYNLETGQVVPVAEMRNERRSPGVVEFNSSIYVFGGIRGSAGTVERYDPREGMWCNTGCSVEIDECTSTVLSQSIYSKSRDSPSLFNFDPRTNSSFCVSSDKDRTRGSIAALGGTLYLASDEGIYEFNAETKCWNQLHKQWFEIPLIIT